VRAPIDVVSRIQGSVLIRGDISETTTIVVEGVQKVREGSPVEIMNAPRGGADADKSNSLMKTDL
jgi:hypothetical protein